MKEISSTGNTQPHIMTRLKVEESLPDLEVTPEINQLLRWKIPFYWCEVLNSPAVLMGSHIVGDE